MSETRSSHDQVAALFYKEGSLFIPPFEIAKERRAENESYEKTFYRLCGHHGITGYAEPNSQFSVIDEDGAYIRGRVMQPRSAELDNVYTEFLVPFDQVHGYLASENGLALRTETDKKLVLAAHALLQAR